VSLIAGPVDELIQTSKEAAKNAADWWAVKLAWEAKKHQYISRTSSQFDGRAHQKPTSSIKSVFCFCDSVCELVMPECLPAKDMRVQAKRASIELINRFLPQNANSC
jgi:hypothetical protein